MKYKHLKSYVLNKASALLLALALSLSLFIPVTGINVYAAEDSNGHAATTVSGYKTSHNARNNEALNIEADITPAGGREVQLQRYNSTDNTWVTIGTANAGADENAPADENDENDENTDERSEEAAKHSGKESAKESAHVSFAVPQEERMKTASVWRLYVPATENAAEACSEDIHLTTRNLDNLNLSARTACIYRIDADGKGTMIYSKNSFTKVAQASTTKLMTAVLLLESGLIDSSTKISPHAASTPWGSGCMAAGDVYSNRDLLYAMLLPSSNDAATAVAEGVGGSEGAFINMMNAKAKELGFTRTHFCNPHGLDADGHYTTALELAKLTAYAYTFPEIRECWGTRCKTIKSLKRGRRWTLWTTNALFSYVSNFLGGKTGTEDNARCCFTGVYTCNGSTYVTVVLGSGYGFSRWSDTKKLHKYIQDYASTSY